MEYFDIRGAEGDKAKNSCFGVMLAPRLPLPVQPSSGLLVTLLCLSLPRASEGLGRLA